MMMMNMSMNVPVFPQFTLSLYHSSLKWRVPHFVVGRELRLGGQGLAVCLEGHSICSNLVECIIAEKWPHLVAPSVVCCWAAMHPPSPPSVPWTLLSCYCLPVFKVFCRGHPDDLRKVFTSLLVFFPAWDSCDLWSLQFTPLCILLHQRERKLR